jgi:hypothetical protein
VYVRKREGVLEDGIVLIGLETEIGSKAAVLDTPCELLEAVPAADDDKDDMGMP